MQRFAINLQGFLHRPAKQNHPTPPPHYQKLPALPTQLNYAPTIVSPEPSASTESGCVAAVADAHGEVDSS